MRLLNIAAACVLAASQLTAATFKLKEQAVVDGPGVLAREVLDPAPEGEAGKVVVTSIGKPGATKEIARDVVAFKLRKSGMFEEPLAVTGRSCRLKASQRSVPGRDVLAFAKHYLESQNQVVSGTVEIESPAPPMDLKVPDRETRLEPSGSRGASARGRQIVRVSAMQTGPQGEDVEVGMVALQFLVKVSKPMVVAGRPLTRGEKLDRDNIEVKTKDITFLPEEGFSEPEEVIGLMARRTIQADQVLTAAMLEMPVVVRTGDILQLTVKSRGVSVVSPAKAMRDAKAGESIPVEVIQTKKMVQATVKDGKNAVVEVQ